MDLRSYLEHTLLRPDATKMDIHHLLDEAIEHRFFGVCIAPAWIPLASAYLRHRSGAIPIVTVVGFPHGNCSTQGKCADAEQAVRAGAIEVDMVMDIGHFKSGDHDVVAADVRSVAQASKSAGALAVKVILETGFLAEAEIAAACRLAERAGADFVKTSTGFGPRGASIADVRLMSQTVGTRLGVKASGGIRTRQDALAMIAAGATRIGASSSPRLVAEGA